MVNENNRKSLRLQGYDYSSPGAYFVTICTYKRACLFGDIINEEMNENMAGKMIRDSWINIAKGFPGIVLDECIVMPNHFHGILWFGKQEHDDFKIELPIRKPHHANPPKGTKSNSLGRIIQGFKSLTTNYYIKNVRENGWHRFDGHLWQRNYWEHVIRNEDDLNEIRQYIIDNPSAWDRDKMNPDFKGGD